MLSAQESYSFVFSSEKDQAIRVTTTETAKQYEYCDSGDCELLGAIPNLEFTTDYEKFEVKDLSILESAPGSLLAGIVFLGGAYLSIRIAIKTAKQTGPGSQGSPNYHIESVLIGLLGVIGSMGFSSEIYDMYEEWVIGDKISTYEHESIMRTLLKMDKHMNTKSSVVFIEENPSVFRNELKLAIKSVNEILGATP
jgi:hypothetical protein